MKEYSKKVEEFAEFVSCCYFGKDKKTFFNLFNYQKDLIEFFENNDQVICKKFRQGGFTTLSYLYLFYKLCYSEKPLKGLFVNPNYPKVPNINIPNVILDDVLNNESDPRQTKFKNGSLIDFSSSFNLCKFNKLEYDYIIFDEAAFYSDFTNTWDVLLHNNKDYKGKFFVISNPGDKYYDNKNNLNWFYKVYNNTKKYYLNDLFPLLGVPFIYEPNVYSCPLHDINELKKSDVFENYYLGEFNECKFQIYHNDKEPVLCGESQEVKNDRVIDAINQQFDKTCCGTHSEPSFAKQYNLLNTIPELETKEALKERLEKLGCKSVVPKLEIPSSNDDNVVEDLKPVEIFEDLAKLMPECYGDVYNQMLKEKEDLEKSQYSLFNHDRSKQLYNLKQRIAKGLPKEIVIDITPECLFINNIPTKINGRIIDCLFKGLYYFEGELIALQEVSNKVRNELQKLF